MLSYTRCLLLSVALVYTFAFAPATAADGCRAAPASRLRAGMTVVVAPGIDRLNLRMLPAVDTGVARQLRDGDRLTILDGPSCNGAYTWWRAEAETGERGWVAEGDWESYYVNPARALDRVVNSWQWTCHRLNARLCPVP